MPKIATKMKGKWEKGNGKRENHEWGNGCGGKRVGTMLPLAAQLLPTANRFVGTEKSRGETFV